MSGVVNALSSDEEKDGFLLEDLPTETTPFPMVVLANLLDLYKSNIEHLNNQIEANTHDAPWCKELREALTDVQSRVRSVKDILSLYSAHDNKGKEKGVKLLRMEREKAIQLYGYFVKAHPKG